MEMNGKKEWYVRLADGNVYGPADMASLVSWAEDGRIDPSSSLSRDRMEWIPAQLTGELEMKWLVEIEPGKVLGPYNRKFLVSSSADGSLSSNAKLYRLHEFPIDEDPPPKIVEKVVERIVEKVVEVEKPPRTTVVVPEVVEPAGNEPPRRASGAGTFGDADMSGLEALEQAARRELAAVGNARFGFFGRRKQ